MSNLNLTSYPRETLEHVLKIVKLYRSHLKQIGKRADFIDPENPPAIRAIVEVHPDIDRDMAQKYAESVIRFAFPNYTGISPVVKINAALKGGARVFVGDDMVDVSMQKFENLLQ